MGDKISIIIPVYNTEAYLERCLSSILNNTYGNFEVICINDGSTDGSLNILEQFAKQDARIIIINQENQGVSSARNAGMNAASGDYIAFIDSDDWVHQKYFELFAKTQECVNCDMVVFPFARVGIGKINEFRFPEMEFDESCVTVLDLEGVFNNHYAKGCMGGKFYRKEFVKGILFFNNVSFAEDALFTAMILAQHPDVKTAYIDLKAYYYLDRPNSLLHQSNAGKVLLAAKAYMDLANDAQHNITKKVFYTEVIKRLLVARYEAKVTQKHQNVVEECKTMFPKAFKGLKGLNVSFKEMFKYRILVSFPFIYRIFRIIDDPTMLDWERSVKRQLNK